ncbi:MAG: hypothetical protein IJ937_13280 [Treponema sp.]|nr:hypothetical protein [Treponema sp.]
MPTILNVEKKILIPNHQETARYLGYSKLSAPDSQIASLIEQAATQMHKIINPKAVFQDFQLEITFSPENQNQENPIIKLKDTNFQLQSKDLYKNLKNCHKVYLLACTLGPQVDSLIRKTQFTDQVMASVFQSTGAMYIEEVVDFANNQIAQIEKNQNNFTRPRFSPGFGDVSLEVQKDFFSLLPCSKIGLSLMDTLIMAPEKSVTAFIGIYKNNH